MALNSAARVIVSIIPIVGIVMGSTVVFFWMLWDHRRKTLLIKNNLYKPVKFDLPMFSLLCGLLLGILGIVLTVFLVVAVGPGYALLGGLIPLAVGIALLAFYTINQKSSSR